MNILVLMKQVADTEARILIKSDKRSLEIENKYNINFFDEFAIEEAIRIKERDKESQVTVCSLGTKKTIEALRTAIAMGADRAFLLDDTNVAVDDPLITGKILAAFARKESFDVILCGRQAIDDENGAVGVMVAEYLKIPHLTAVSKLEFIERKRARVEAEFEGGRQTLDIELPALFTVQKGINEPRVPLITGVMRAMKTEITTEQPIALGLSDEEIGFASARVIVASYETPAGRPPVRIIEGETPEMKVMNLIRALKEDARVL